MAESLEVMKVEIMPTADDDQSVESLIDRCTAHDEKKLSIYCETCRLCICHECVFWAGTHSGHTIKRVEEVYREQKIVIKEEIRKLRRRRMEYQSLGKNIGRKIELVRTWVDNDYKLMTARFEAQKRSKLGTLMNLKNTLTNETGLVEKWIHDAEQILQSKSRHGIISTANEIVSRTSSLIPMSCFDDNNVPSNFTSEIVPTYDSDTFVLKKFSELRRQAKPVYMTLHTNGLWWRLIVYLDDHLTDQGNFLSIRLMLTKGPPYSSKYEYRVELVHKDSRDEKKNFVKQSEDYFQIGECKGFDRFFRIGRLATEGYLNTENDTLIIRFQVRAPTFFLKCRDQQWYITHLERNLQKRDKDDIRNCFILFFIFTLLLLIFDSFSCRSHIMRNLLN